MYFFSECRPILEHFLKKIVFFPLEMSNTCKIFLNPKVLGLPPPFFTQIYSNPNISSIWYSLFDKISETKYIRYSQHCFRSTTRLPWSTTTTTTWPRSRQSWSQMSLTRRRPRDWGVQENNSSNRCLHLTTSPPQNQNKPATLWISIIVTTLVISRARRSISTRTRRQWRERVQ